MTHSSGLPAIIRTERSDHDPIAKIRSLVLDSVTSPRSKRAYGAGIDRFLIWHKSTLPGTGFTRAAVQAYRAHLLEQGLAPSSINVQLSAIRALAREGADNGLIDSNIAGGIDRVKGVHQAGTRLGHWLTGAQAEELIDAPGNATLKGKRDRALLGLMLGSGLRREEIASLTIEHIQQREGRWLITDLTGKGKRIRSVPIPSFSKALIDVWTTAARITEGRLFRPVNRGDHMVGESMTAQAVFSAVKLHAKAIGLEDIAPHDLRRSFAKLSFKGMSPISQISLSLGHSSVKTTEIYVGVEQDIQNAPCDTLGLKVKV